MNRLRQPGDSDYDVLGVSPGATAEEINFAFRRLIDGQGYRAGMPLNRHWLRAHQIKTAHATLADPEKRRAYDESLTQASGSAPWAMTAKDTATDELILPQIEPEAAEPVEHQSTPDAVVPRNPDVCALTSSDPKRALDWALKPAAEDAVGSAQEDPVPPHVAPALDGSEQASVRPWGMVTAAAFGLGLVLLASWPAWNRQPSAGEGIPTVTAYAGQASGTSPGLGQFPARAPGDFNGTGPSDPEAQGASPGDSPAALAAPGRPLELDDASDEGATQDASDLAAHADTAPTTTTAAAPGRSPAPAEAVAAQAIEPPPTPPIAILPAWAGISGSLVRTPPRWVGGGPTNADNRSGRYQGTVAVQVTVKPDGRVSNCAPVRGSGNAGLDAMTCRLVRKRARFAPALDAQGRPVVSQTYTTFVWSSRRGN